MERIQTVKLWHPSEEQEQEALFRWAAWNETVMPELALLHHVPNGGLRNKAVAAKLKRMGVKAGVPDICLPVARGGYHGLYIELKAGKNKTTEKQNNWEAMLSQQGYKAITCYGFDAARKEITNYLTGEQNEH